MTEDFEVWISDLNSNFLHSLALKKNVFISSDHINCAQEIQTVQSVSLASSKDRIAIMFTAALPWLPK